MYMDDQVVTDLLLELNPDVTGQFRQADPAYVIENEPRYFEQFSLIVATQSNPISVRMLSNLCYDLNKPLFLLDANGLLGRCRVQVRDHTIIESKPEPERDDLRIARPFQELQEYADGFELESLDSLEHAHVPVTVSERSKSSPSGSCQSNIW